MRLKVHSLRGRLVGLFAIGLTIVIAGASTAVYATLVAQLDRSVNDRLSKRADIIAGALDLKRPNIDEDYGFGIVLTFDGSVVTASSTIRRPRSVLTATELAEATTTVVSINRTVPGLGQHARLLAQPENIGGEHLIVVTGTSLDAQVDARQRVFTTLAIGGPLLSLLLAVGAWFVVTAALRPVRRISEEAEEVSRLDIGRRLPEPATTELAQLARNLNAMLDRLAESFERERAFVDDASHELRTPIAILRGELELASGSTDVDELRHAVGSALEEAVRLADMAEGLLVLARSGVDNALQMSEPIDLFALVSDVARRLERVDRREVRVDVEGAAGMHGHRRAIEQIVDNLVANARRYANDRVTVQIATRGVQTVISVCDDGPGFPEQFLVSAFDRFSQADPSRRRASGAGLGLAIVSALIERQGGTVTARNGPPLGGGVVEVTLATGH